MLYAEETEAVKYPAWPGWLRLAVDLADAGVNGQYKPG
jgi:hypothetical protein